MTSCTRTPCTRTSRIRGCSARFGPGFFSMSPPRYNIWSTAHGQCASWQRGEPTWSDEDASTLCGTDQQLAVSLCPSFRSSLVPLSSISRDVRNIVALEKEAASWHICTLLLLLFFSALDLAGLLVVTVGVSPTRLLVSRCACLHSAVVGQGRTDG